MRYLILGSNGLVGHGLTAYLESKGHKVTGIDIAFGNSHDLRWYNNQYFLDCLDLADFVYFFAFDIGGSKYLSQYERTFDFVSNNTKIMNTVFDGLYKTQKPFIFASSQMSQMNHSAYGCLKLLGEHYTSILDGLTVRFWNVYGYEPIGDRSHVVADFIHTAKQNQQIAMLTDGNEQRQLLHVDDCSTALYNLSLNYDNIGRNEQLHITNFKWTKIAELAQEVAKHFPGCKIVAGEKKDTVQHSILNEPSTDILKYWTPSIDLQTGIEKTVQCY